MKGLPRLIKQSRELVGVSLPAAPTYRIINLSPATTNPSEPLFEARAGKLFTKPRPSRFSSRRLSQVSHAEQAGHSSH